MPREINAAFPPKLIHPLLESTSRYIVLYGGRAGGKSWATARALLLRSVQKPMRILCCREFMSSVADSQHKLLADQIRAMDLDDLFTVEKATIYGINGSEIRFAGIRNNVDSIRSFEGVDLAWCEEAANITVASWQTLIPTIRKENSQIVLTFNPAQVADETYQRFVVNPPPNAEVVKINYDENPFCPQVVKEEASYLRETDYDAYQHVWLGHPQLTLTDAVYANELRKCQDDGRITSVLYDEFTPVQCFYDLGWRDYTSIVLAQMVGMEVHVIDFVQGHKRSITDYLRELQSKPYLYEMHHLPHDAGATALQTGRSIEQVMRKAGCRVKVHPRMSITDGINAARLLFGRMWFDEKKCADLLQALRHYRWDEKYKNKPQPLHDENSHAADAIRLMALSLKEPLPPAKLKQAIHDPRPTGWMA